ncbi:MAG TPA: hypothetical protein DIC35_00260 [Candidatus Moranbacteria bacterium]|nr:hypothetical protein [Candidatus Moranbacteria bacterium]
MKKVEEEAHELANADSKEHVAEEVADVMELIGAILDFNGLDWETIGKIQKEDSYAGKSLIFLRAWQIDIFCYCDLKKSRGSLQTQ